MFIFLKKENDSRIRTKTGEGKSGVLYVQNCVRDMCMYVVNNLLLILPLQM